ncbi:hypothetical protein AB0937_02715 [Streptomyces sp. NPDC047880]|uniref:hypothetical protein n=1 Tax=Streptomyces sp. NPDC047880 TaxID=3155626 RepID=UPI0034525105
MHKFKKAAALAVMVGGIGLAGGGVASANGGYSSDPFPGVAVENLQVLQCEQEFDAGAAFAPVTGAVTGDNDQNTGNFCAQVAVED